MTTKNSPYQIVCLRHHHASHVSSKVSTWLKENWVIHVLILYSQSVIVVLQLSQCTAHINPNHACTILKSSIGWSKYSMFSFWIHVIFVNWHVTQCLTKKNGWNGDFTIVQNEQFGWVRVIYWFNIYSLFFLNIF